MPPAVNIPRIVIAGSGSGVGKTTATVALIAALRARGLTVAPFKCGPDYLDPTYHERAAGRTSHNLDGWMMGRDAVIATFVRAARDADIAVIEGMMGLFDGATPTADEGSTAEIAKWLAAPVVLAIDASGIARTVAAIAHGFAGFDPAVATGGIDLQPHRRPRPSRPAAGGVGQGSRPRRIAAQFGTGLPGTPSRTLQRRRSRASPRKRSRRGERSRRNGSTSTQS